MSRNEKKIDFPEIMKHLLVLPNYEETPRKKNISFVSSRVKSESCSTKENGFSGLSSLYSKSFSDSLFKSADQLKDSDFFDSETGKKLILADTASRQEFSLQTKDPSTTGCSSWDPFSRINVSHQHDVRLSQYIKAYSDSVNGSLFQISSFDPEYSDCSTPVQRRTSVLSTETQTKDFFDFSNVTVTEKTEDFQSFDNYDSRMKNLESLSDKNYLFSIKKNAYEKKSSYKTPEKDESVLECFKQSLGSSNYRLIKRLKAEESSKAASVTGESSTDSYYQRDFVTPRSSELTSTLPISTDWLIEPTNLTLDSSKGARVLLINNSSRNLKFSSKFDAKIASICPLNGVIPARSRIGLRIVISSFVKKSLESAEDEIKIIVENEEKSIHLKITKGQKAKTLKTRSFITF